MGTPASKTIKYINGVLCYMLKSFATGLSDLVKRPFLIFPSFVAMVVNTALLILVSDSMFTIFYNVFILGDVPDATITQLPFYIISSYGPELTAITATTFISLLLSFYLVYVYSGLLNSKSTGVVKAMLGGFSRLGELIALSVFVSLCIFLFSMAGFAFFVGSLGLGGIGIISFLLGLAWTLFGAYVFLKLVFAPVLMAIGKKKLKAALAESWEWSSGKLLHIGAFMVLLFAAIGFINLVVSSASDATGIEELSLVILVLGMALSNAYYNIVFIRYFVDSR